MIALKIFPKLITIFLFGLCGADYVSAATFYVSPSGNDTNSGLSPEKAWQTPTRVNRTTFSPGDRILFEGGKTFQGPVKFDAKDGGSKDNPLLLGSYRLEEAGSAIIAAHKERGIDVYNTSGLCISDLKIIGAGPKINRTSGILLHTSRPEGASHITIENVEVSGFGKHGISIGAWKSNKGYRNVSITRTRTHDNLRTGILSWGPWGPHIYAHSKIYIGYCETYNMKGGSGITLSSVNDAIIERSIAHDNGEEFSGAAGIWAWDSNNIIIQFNESYNNRTRDVDGDGFDFDGGVTNSIMQYNYSHDNDAAGYLLAQYPGAPQAMSNIIIRYNISENDCRKKGYGAIHLWN
ncbi:MAG: right-handed parallel beta-helix repeat-containing protein [Chthoniobacterales bacterium]